jgi:ribosomal protein S18 acetylase RimI-like enzyme
MPIEYRILRAGDEALLAGTAADVFDDPILPRAAREFLADPRHHLAVAVDHQVVIGFASGVHYVHPDKPFPEFWINEVGVAPAYQNQGVGKAIMRSLLAVARELGCKEAWVLTEGDNTPAMRLYQTLGGEKAPEDTVMFTFSFD